MKKEKRGKSHVQPSNNKTGKSTKESIETGKKAIMVKKKTDNKDNAGAANAEKKDATRWRNEG